MSLYHGNSGDSLLTPTPENSLRLTDTTNHIIPSLLSMPSISARTVTEQALSASQSEASISVHERALLRHLARSHTSNETEQDNSQSTRYPPRLHPVMGRVLPHSFGQPRSVLGTARPSEMNRESSRVTKRDQDLDESPKFKMRRARIREMERLQDLEDERDIDKQKGLEILNALLTSHPFSNVNATFEDLDGLAHKWDECNVRRNMKERWNQKHLHVKSGHLDNVLIDHRAVHALYADLRNSGHGFVHSQSRESSSWMVSSISAPYISRQRSLSRVASVGGPRPLRIRRTSLSSTLRSRSGCSTNAVAQPSENSTEVGTHTIRMNYTSSEDLDSPPQRISGLSTGSHTRRRDPKSKETLAGDNQTAGKVCLPRMTRTMSSFSSDGLGCGIMPPDVLLNINAPEVAAREQQRDASEDTEAPLMMRVKSSAGSSSSSFGVRPLRVKKRSGPVIRPDTKLQIHGLERTSESMGPEGEQEDIEIEELERILLAADQSLDGDLLTEKRPLPPPPQTSQRYLTWSGSQASYSLESTISRATGRGRHAIRRPPLPFVNAMEQYIEDPSSLRPLQEVLREPVVC